MNVSLSPQRFRGPITQFSICISAILTQISPRRSERNDTVYYHFRRYDEDNVSFVTLFLVANDMSLPFSSEDRHTAQ
ncbi:hypothetical protein NPIL_428541, partial [Nephila pilipes]